MSENERVTVVGVPIPDDLRKAIEDYRFETRCKNRAVAIRNLIKAGLDQHEASRTTTGSTDA